MSFEENMRALDAYDLMYNRPEPPPAPDWPSTIENPYWEIVSKIPGDDLSLLRHRWEPESFPLREALADSSRTVERVVELLETRPSRRHLTIRYSWAIPSPPAIDWVVTQLAGEPVVEIGAGTGYWAWMLSQSGVDIVAYDLYPPAREPNEYHGPQNNMLQLTGEPGVEYYPVRRGGPSALKAHRDRVLFLCWPPFNEDLAINALRTYTGDRLLFCGELYGMTGSQEFYARLENEWEEIEDCRYHVSWSGMHDHLTLYGRS